MEQTKNEPPKPVVAGPVGIIERLKRATEANVVAALAEEFKTYTQASAKTKRRFFNLLAAK